MKSNYPNTFKEKVYEIMFETNTPPHKIFDSLLSFTILLSVLTVVLESVSSLHQSYGSVFIKAEWFFTILFTLEYIVRISVAPKSAKYPSSFFGVIDLISILPTYAVLVFGGSSAFLTIRILRLLRLFRVFKLARYIKEADILLSAIKASKPKIIVFFFTTFFIVIIAGAMMFVIEGPENGFTSIPTGIYWAIGTLTTTGYGDIVPNTGPGKFIASLLMLLAYAVLAVPTGIVSAEIVRASSSDKIFFYCPNCEKSNEENSHFCRHCGKNIKSR